jgi:hypothetical protein
MISCRRYRRNGELKAAMGEILYFLDVEITILLKAWSGAIGRARSVVHAGLPRTGRMARRHTKGERRDNTLQTTALVHALHLRLVAITK